jgi:hypothetical protein
VNLGFEAIGNAVHVEYRQQRSPYVWNPTMATPVRAASSGTADTCALDEHATGSNGRYRRCLVCLSARAI